ncbi:MAG: hypothetical protein R3F35_06900 [Myxococcota bacterium]
MARDVAPGLLAALDRAPLADGDPEFALFGGWWARSDPDAAHGWTRVAPEAGATSVLVEVLQAWGERAPSDAVRVAQQETLAIRRTAALQAAFLGAERALSDARAWAEVAATVSDRAELRAALLPMLVRRLDRDGVASLLAWAEAARSPDPAVRHDLVGAVAMAIVDRDPVAAVGVLATHAAGRRSGDRDEAAESGLPADVVERIAQVWVERDPEATFDWLSSLEAGAPRSAAVRLAYERWLGRDREAALAWGAERAEQPDRWLDPVRAAYALLLGQDDPEAGLRLLFMLPIERERALKVQGILANWKGHDPQAAADWIEQADLPELRKQALRAIPARQPLVVGRPATGSGEGS